MTLIEAEPAYDLTGIAPWPPPRCTAPLDPAFTSLYERHRVMLGKAWYAANGYVLERWQEQLLHAITELTPLGVLRYREVLVSLGRQNGKTEIAAALGLLFMYHKHSPTIISIAKSADQANIVYRRAQKIIAGSATLSGLFRKLTETRGLKTKRGGVWEIKASKSDALQGIPVDLGIVDEVHLMRGPLWDDMVNGLGGRDNCMVVGITTAGDDDSTHLLHLYERPDSDTFGKFIWEAPEAIVPPDDETLARWLAMSNPAVASGRVSIKNVVSDVRGMPAESAIRYRLNRFVSGSDKAYVAIPDWNRLAVDAVEIGRPILTVDRTPDWSRATVVVTGRADDDVIEIDVAREVDYPSVDTLFALCESMFAKVSPETFVVDGYTLGPLAKKLKENGYPVRTMAYGDEVSAASMFYSKVVRRQLRWARNPGTLALASSFQNVIRKDAHGDQYKLIKGTGPQSISAALAVVRGVYAAETTDDGGSLIV